ncbi:MAG: hypothetical protein V4481_05265 [Patescibacteria group bacterium]
MATINAQTGQIMGTPGVNDSGSQNPYNTYVSNMGNLLSYITTKSASGNADMQANVEGLQRGEAALATPGTGNPLNSILNLMPGSMRTGTESTLGQIMEPAILSNKGQAQVAEENSGNLTNEVRGQIDAYNAMKPSWTLSPTPNENGEFYFYNTNVQPGQPPQVYPAGKIPPGASGSAGGSPGSADSTQTLAQSNNPYGIKMTPGTESIYADLGATPGPKAVDGGNFWSFPDASSGEKAARRLLTSATYATDSVDQALRHWSNYTGTGQYPGYNSDILKGTGIDPNALIKNLSSAQIDVVLSAMKKAENVGSANAGQPGNLIEKAASQVANGTIGFDDAFNSVNGLYNGKFTKTQFISAIQKIKPDFNVNQSNSVASGQGANTELAAKTSALIDKTNQTLDLLPDAFDKVSPFQQLGGDWVSGPMNFLSGKTGLGKTETDNYNRILSEARASANAVLSTAANLGVVTGGKTADSLLPDNMDKKGLTTAIATIKDLEEKTKVALAKLSNASATNSGTDIKSLRAKYNY